MQRVRRGEDHTLPVGVLLKVGEAGEEFGVDRLRWDEHHGEATRLTRNHILGADRVNVRLKRRAELCCGGGVASDKLLIRLKWELGVNADTV